MNERIRELAEQSNFQFNSLGGTYTSGTLGDNLEKFAELIVQECLNTMENCDGDLDFAIWKTKEHFGVKQ